ACPAGVPPVVASGAAAADGVPIRLANVAFAGAAVVAVAVVAAGAATGCGARTEFSCAMREITASTDIAYLGNRENRPLGDGWQQREPSGRAVASHAAAAEVPTDCRISTHWREVACALRCSDTYALAASPTRRRRPASSTSRSRCSRIWSGVA